MDTVILEKKFDYQNRLFALCESCYWTATIFVKLERYHCPVCHCEHVALISLSRDEKDEYSLKAEQGLQISFSLLGKKLENNIGTDHS